MCYFVSVDLLHRCRFLTSHVTALPRQTTNPSYPNEIHLEARHRADFGLRGLGHDRTTQT